MNLGNPAAASRIIDVGVASESANCTRSHILQQAASAVLSQANQAPGLVTGVTARLLVPTPHGGPFLTSDNGTLSLVRGASAPPAASFIFPAHPVACDEKATLLTR